LLPSFPTRRSSDLGCTPFFELSKSMCDRLQIILVIDAAFHRIDALDPLRKTFLPADCEAHHRVIEMAMRVDQAGQQRALTEIEYRTGIKPRQIFKRSDRANRISTHGHRAV